LSHLSMEPIGYVVNNVSEPMDKGWGEVESKIILKEELTVALKGLGSFSHILVVFWMHQTKPPAVFQRHPQDRDDMPELGLFAQRSKHRPNPIGITTVSLIRLDGNNVIVRGLDAINGTPILDIKPYYPHYDRPSKVHVPEWVNNLMNGYF